MGRTVTADAGAARKEGTKDREWEQEQDVRNRMKPERKRVVPDCSLPEASVEILQATENYLYNTDERTETENKVESGQGRRVRFGPQPTGGFCHLEMGSDRAANGAKDITVKFRVSRGSARGKKKRIILPSLLLLSRTIA